MNDRQDNSNDVIQAAGGLVWRQSSRGPEVVLVHRPRYDDWSFPKGKMEAGESWTETALREVEEETGLDVTLDDFAGSHSYQVRKRVKVVLFWNMQIHQETPFVANEEVDHMKWSSIDHALELLNYGDERDLLRAVVLAKWPDR